MVHTTGWFQLIAIDAIAKLSQSIYEKFITLIFYTGNSCFTLVNRLAIGV